MSAVPVKALKEGPSPSSSFWCCWQLWAVIGLWLHLSHLCSVFRAVASPLGICAQMALS